MEVDDPYRAPATMPVAAPPFSPAPRIATRDVVAAAYYSPPTLKLASLSLVTLGLYPLYWFWQNWRAIKRETGGTQWPWARALFAPLWSFLCFSDLRDIAVSRRRELAFAPGLLAAVYFLLNLGGRLPGGMGLVSLLTFVPLLPINSLLPHGTRQVVCQQKGEIDRLQGQVGSGLRVTGGTAGMAGRHHHDPPGRQR